MPRRQPTPRPQVLPQSARSPCPPQPNIQAPPGRIRAGGPRHRRPNPFSIASVPSHRAPSVRVRAPTDQRNPASSGARRNGKRGMRRRPVGAVDYRFRGRRGGLGRTGTGTATPGSTSSIRFPMRSAHSASFSRQFFCRGLVTSRRPSTQYMHGSTTAVFKKSPCFFCTPTIFAPHFGRLSRSTSCSHGGGFKTWVSSDTPHGFGWMAGPPSMP